MEAVPARALDTVPAILANKAPAITLSRGFHMSTRPVRSTFAAWLFFGAATALSLAMSVAVFQVGFRYVYQTDATFGHTIRLDRLTGEQCAYSGSKRVLDRLSIPHCTS